MKRREFIKGCAAAGALIILPNQAEAGDGVALTSIAHPYNPPKNCRELQRIMEALFDSEPAHTVRSHVEFVSVTPACRVVPVTYVVRGQSEAEVVAWAYKDIFKMAEHTDYRDRLLWRMAPYIMQDYKAGEFGERIPASDGGMILRMRFGVIPYDLRPDHLFTHGGKIAMVLPGVKKEGARHG